MIRNILIAATLIASAPTALAQQVAITGGRIVTNTTQGVIENGTVVINNGRIVSVGTGAAPAGATVVDANGKWITPGLFAAFSRVGLTEIPSENPANDVSASNSKFQASLHAADSFNPDDTAIDVNRIEGFTRAAIVGSPAGSLFGGYAAIVDFSGGFNVEVVEGRVPLMVEVHRAADILQLLTLRQREPRIKLIILGATEGWRVADQIAAADVPVIVNPLANLPDRMEILAATLENAGRLSSAGVTVAIADPGEASHNTRFIQQLAGNAVANGMKWEDAFKAITSVPATIYGRADLGVLRTGATADVVIWDGDPLELMSSPDAVYIDGVSTPMESRQTKLRDRYLQLNEDRPQAYERQ